MDYEQLLELSPFDTDQKTKEVWYCEMFEQLTKDHKNDAKSINIFWKVLIRKKILRR